MPRCVSYRIVDRDDGRFDVIASIAPDRVYRRDGFDSLAAIEDWIDGLRILMGAIGAPVAQADEGSVAPGTPDEAVASAGFRLQRFLESVSAAGPDDGESGPSDIGMGVIGGERRS